MLVTKVARAMLGKAATATSSVLKCGGSSFRAFFHMSIATKMSSAPIENAMNAALIFRIGKLLEVVKLDHEREVQGYRGKQ